MLHLLTVWQLSKLTIACAFGRGEDKKAEDFKKLAEENKYLVEQNEKIEPSTLRAFVKERVEQGDEFPMELFGAYIGQRAVIKRGK